MSSGLQQKQSHRKQQIEWRRTKILELMSKGENNQSEIARILQIDRSTVSRDLVYFRQQAKEEFRTYLDERLSTEFEKCFLGITSILKEAWTISSSEDKREKIQALSLAKECYAMMLDMMSSAPVVERAVQFVDRNRGLMSQNKEVRMDDTARP